MPEPNPHSLRQQTLAELAITMEMLDERERQDIQWGGPAVDDLRDVSDWLRFITKQRDRASLTQNAFTAAFAFDTDVVAARKQKYRACLVRIGALAIAAIASLDRNEAIRNEAIRNEDIAAKPQPAAEPIPQPAASPPTEPYSVPPPSLGTEQRIILLNSLGFASATYHWQPTLVWVGCYYLHIRDADRLILALIQLPPTDRHVPSEDLAVIAGVRGNSSRTKEDVLGHYERRALDASAPPPPMPTIKHAAIKVGDIVFVGKRHHDVFRTLAECGYIPSESQKCPQGFVTSTGEFVDRLRASEIAVAAGQMHPVGGASARRELYSEDLY